MESQDKIHMLIDSFREVKKASNQLLSRQAEQLGITRIQFMTLTALMKQPHIGLTELADSLRMGNSTMSGIINRLVKAGLVERKRVDTDRRSVALQLTEKGKEVEKQTYLLYSEALSALSDIPDEDIDNLIAVHRQIINKLEKEREGTLHEHKPGTSDGADL
ncbi:hypothetical protein DCC85_08240 [Paenibacillus sp. CAA11]|uniref:MarR family winged helix-turn-helix transcriptional regulator n=1 Tax=Paenibacillus sp. CAA11 TaxID=1532905 RepID=UPI000D35BEF7|nr:MarR family transcriptional regulator [Paenibacillus sp. CAA11]AWB44201.1 hypothetical protein DCC85_08240 [Paenibacillus sp. CAA11]